MLDYLYEFAIRAAVMLPVIVVMAALAWVALKRFGAMTPGAPFNAADMRTWPLGFALTDAAIFGIVFAGIAAWMGEGEWTGAVGAGVAALVAIGLAPRLAERVLRR